MQGEWILGGVLLLACALPVKVLWEKAALQRLALGVNVTWSILAAFHFWPSVRYYLSGPLAGFEAVPLEVASLWVGFCLAALPGWALVRWGVGDTHAVLPVWFEWLTGVVFTAAVALLLPCLVIVSATLLPAQRFLPSAGIPGQCVVLMRRAPLEFYLQAAAAAGEDAARLKAGLPPRLRSANGRVPG